MMHHVEAARALAPKVPHAAVPGLLQNVLLARYGAELAGVQHAPFAFGLAPLYDASALARMRRLGAQLVAAVRGTY